MPSRLASNLTAHQCSGGDGAGRVAAEGHGLPRAPRDDRVEMMVGSIRHEDALERRNRRRSHSDSAAELQPTTDSDASTETPSTGALLRVGSSTPSTSKRSRRRSVERAVVVRRRLGARGARSRNENTLLLLIGIGIGSLLFGFVVLRSFASPLTRLRLQAERISRGELNAEPIPVAGPSDVRKVTGAINDMASTLSLVEDHMDALALAELNELPELDALPGHVGSTMKASMERVVALTTRLQTSESRLAEEARIDNLTGLPNRFAVLEYLERTLSALAATSNQPGTIQPIGVMFLDVDGFKSCQRHPRSRRRRRRAARHRPASSRVDPRRRLRRPTRRGRIPRDRGRRQRPRLASSVSVNG